MKEGGLYKSYNSGHIYRYDGEVDGWHFLTIVKPGPTEQDMEGISLEYTGHCPLLLTEVEE